ncbi:MAG: HAD family hydrolase, partial [Promethearchaeota archaeon]
LEEYKIRWTSGIEDFFKSDELLKYTYLYNDVEILEWLLEKGYNMTVLTNGLPKYQDQVIEKLGLQRFFKRITMPNPDEIKLIKPQPEIFRLATRGFQESESHVMIGDSLYFDIYGAKKVGYKAIWLIRKLPKKLKELSIQYRTDKINENKQFLLKYILRSAPFLAFSSIQNNLNEFKPDRIICNLQELKELF